MSSIEIWTHDHTFGQDRVHPGERPIKIVVALTIVTMVVEIAAGSIYGSMALVADGLHMGSHAAALGISLGAYFFARRFARDSRFSFGTGKVNALGGFSSALLLAILAALMALESIARLFSPVDIAFEQAIFVAVLGLIVNGASALILDIKPAKAPGDAQHGPAHGDRHDHDHDHHDHGLAHDHSLRAAYVHVITDALTSVLAIVALLAGMYMGLAWLDPFMGVVGAAIILHWAWSLLSVTGNVLLDHQAPKELHERIRAAIRGGDGCDVVDLHVWAIGPGIYAAEVVVVADRPNSPQFYKELMQANVNIVHSIVEVHSSRGARPAPARTGV